MKQLWRIIRFTKQLWPFYIAIAGLTIFMSLMAQLQPLFIKSVVDEVTKLIGGGHANVTLVALLALALFATDVGQTILSNIGGYLGDIMSIRLQKILGERYYEHVLSLSQSYFDSELSGKIINRMNRGISNIGEFVQVLSNNFLQFLLTTVFSLIVVSYFSWEVGLLLFFLYPVFLLLTMRTSKKWQVYQGKINERSDLASGRFAEAVGQIRVVKGYLQEKRELHSWQRLYEQIVGFTKPQSRLWHSQDILRRLVMNVISLAVVAYIFIQTARGQYTLGVMVLLIQYVNLIRFPLFTVSWLVDSTQRAISNSKDYFEIMDIKPEIADRPNARSLKITKAELAFKDVHFGYDKDKQILNGVSFTIKPDSKAALVGESGEGKTTLTNLLLRLYDVGSGSILIDGQDVSDVTQSSLRRNIGIVFQDPALFSGTIRENISYANPNASESDIIAAAKAANAHDFIEKFDKGYDSEIGERGLKLSGGQKQRIAIARALLKDAPILILDEATSSLDSRSEHMVQEALQRLMKGRTTLIIAHRLSTIQAVDEIITLRNGRVDEIGTPAQLQKTDGIYAQLLQLQHRDSEADKKKLKSFEIAG